MFVWECVYWSTGSDFTASGQRTISHLLSWKIKRHVSLLRLVCLVVFMLQKVDINTHIHYHFTWSISTYKFHNRSKLIIAILRQFTLNFILFFFKLIKHFIISILNVYIEINLKKCKIVFLNNYYYERFISLIILFFFRYFLFIFFLVINIHANFNTNIKD